MRLILFFLSVFLFGLLGCKEENSVIENSEMLYGDLIGVWDVEFESRYYENDNLKPERNVDGDLIFTISVDHKLLMQDNMSSIINDDICKEIFITESLDEIVTLGLDSGLTVGTSEDRIVTFYDVLSRDENFQIWETVNTLIDFEDNDIRITKRLTMTKR